MAWCIGLACTNSIFSTTEAFVGNGIFAFFQTFRLIQSFYFFFQSYKEKRTVDTLTRMKKDQQSNEENISLPIYLLHPVCQKKKEIYHTEQTTFIIGETPKGIRRSVISNTVESFE